MEGKMDLNKIISLTFDSDPRVRKQAAVELSKYDAPSAMFALVELTYDKDPGVQEISRNMIEEMKKRSTEPELMSFAEVFSQGAKEEEKPAEEEKTSTNKEKMLKPIDQIFEKKFGKEKGEEVKKRMMPAIERIYFKAIKHLEGTTVKAEKAAKVERERKFQDVLSGYLDAFVGVSPAEQPREGAEPKKVEESTLATELGVVGTKEAKPEMAEKELAEAAREDEEGGMAEEEEKAEIEVEMPSELQEDAQAQTIFRFAFDTMMASEGDEKIMQEAAKKMIKDAEGQIELAFKVAKKKYSEIRITNITELKTGMKNVTTGVLFVKSVEHRDYKRTQKKMDTFTRIVVADQNGNEGIVYLFDQRGAPVAPGMKMMVEKGYAKTFDFSGETGMTVSKKGKVYIIL